MPLRHSDVNKAHVRKMLRKLRKLGYIREVYTWYLLEGIQSTVPLKGTYTTSHEQAVVHWEIDKMKAGGWFHIDMFVDNDGDEQYAIFALSYSTAHDERILTKGHDRGAFPEFKITDIIEEQIDLLPKFEELLLAQVENMKTEAKKRKLCAL